MWESKLELIYLTVLCIPTNPYLGSTHITSGAATPPPPQQRKPTTHQHSLHPITLQIHPPRTIHPDPSTQTHPALSAPSHHVPSRIRNAEQDAGTGSKVCNSSARRGVLESC